jgi:hypothetical protein
MADAKPTAKKAAKKAPAKKAESKPKPAPVDVPVEVESTSAPTTVIFGKEYEVTPEGGHRRKG